MNKAQRVGGMYIVSTYLNLWCTLDLFKGVQCSSPGSKVLVFHSFKSPNRELTLQILNLMYMKTQVYLLLPIPNLRDASLGKPNPSKRQSYLGT